MKTIEQLALEVALPLEFHKLGRVGIIDFAKRLVAAWQEQQEPVAWRTETGYEQPRYLYHSIKPNYKREEPLYLAPPPAVQEWLPIETAPKDGTPIIGWCEHEADHYWIEEEKCMTVYGAHSEGLSHVEDGPHILEWGGAWDDRTWEDSSGGYMPDWWFRYGSEFEEAANPTHWQPLPKPPAQGEEK